MPDHDTAKIVVVREWIEKAEHDLMAGAQIMKLGKTAPMETICFHSQQCVEKYLKALLVFEETPFPKSHDISKLVTLISVDRRPDLAQHLQDRLTDYAATTRYPDANVDPSLADAREALAIARRIRKAIRRVLPKAAPRRKKKS